MDTKTSGVAQFATANAAPAATSSASVPSQPAVNSKQDREQRKLAFTRALVHGLARLIEGQRQFADEFGLSLNRVFPSVYKELEGQSATQLAISLFKSDWNCINDLEKLIDDLMMHQVALFICLDGVAMTVLEHMGEDDLMEGKSKINDARAWRLHKERLSEYKENDHVRFEQLVATGFVDKYIRTIEKHKYAKRTAENEKNKNLSDKNKIKNEEVMHDYS